MTFSRLRRYICHDQHGADFYLFEVLWLKDWEEFHSQETHKHARGKLQISTAEKTVNSLRLIRLGFRLSETLMR